MKNKLEKEAEVRAEFLMGMFDNDLGAVIDLLKGNIEVLKTLQDYKDELNLEQKVLEIVLKIN